MIKAQLKKIAVLRKTYRRLKLRIKALFGRDVAVRLANKPPMELHGNPSYGAWSILKDSLNKDSIVISIGIGKDTSFDLSIIEKYGCKVYAFDPTPASIAWVRENIRNPLFIFEPIAIASYDGTLRLWQPSRKGRVSASFAEGKNTSKEYFDAPALRFSSILKKINHNRINVLKMDIEGAEYSVIKDIIASKMLVCVDQLLLEFHHHFSSFSPADTKEIIKMLANEGFFPVWVSEIGHEVVFIRKEKSADPYN